MSPPVAVRLTVIVIGTDVNWIARIIRVTNIGTSPGCLPARPNLDEGRGVGHHVPHDNRRMVMGFAITTPVPVIGVDDS